MPYRLNWESRGLLVRFSGVISPDEIARFFGEVLPDPRYYENRYVIASFTGAVGHSFTMPDDGESQALIAPAIGAGYSNPDMIVAIVVHDDSLRELLRHCSALWVHPVEMFETQEAAQKWVEEWSPSGRHRAPPG